MFDIDSGRTFCSRGVLGSYRVAPPLLGKEVPSKPDYPKRWIIYYTPPAVVPDSPVQLPPFGITDSPLSRPLDQASYDVTILEQLAGRWSR
jgi:hypothetical protein